MKTRFVLFLSSRMLRGKGGTGRYLRGSVIGIALSLVPLIVVMEVSTGMIDGITARLLEVGTYHLQAPQPSDTSLPALESIAGKVSSVPDVVAAIPERQGTGMLVSSRGAAGVSIRCVPADVFARDPGFRSFVTIKAGTSDITDGASLLVSVALASSLGIKVGDQVSVLTTYEENMVGLPRLTPVRVAGIYETGYQELDKTLVYAPLALSARMLSPLSSRALIGIKVKNPFGNLDGITAEVARAIGPDARVATWSEIEYARLSSFRTTKALLLFIMALVVVVASVNVSSSVLMILFERRHEVGILKSVGAAPRSLAFSFLLAGLWTGVLGTAAGIASGLLVAVNINQVIAGLEWLINALISIASLLRSGFVPSAPALGGFTLFNSAYYLKSIPINIDAAEVVVAAVATLLLTAFASYIPAARAARVRPLEILRKV